MTPILMMRRIDKMFVMEISEETIESAIELLRKSKGKKALVAIQDLEDQDDDVVAFYPKLKSECEEIINEAATIASVCDGFVHKLNTFTEKQRDLLDIQPKGKQSTILLKD